MLLSAVLAQYLAGSLLGHTGRRSGFAGVLSDVVDSGHGLRCLDPGKGLRGICGRNFNKRVIGKKACAEGCLT